MDLSVDPSVAQWPGMIRPLDWRRWPMQGHPEALLGVAEIAHLCARLIHELQVLEIAGLGHTWLWRHTHHELLELKTVTS